MTTLFLAICGVLVSTILAIIRIADHIRNKVLIKLDVNNPLVESNILSLNLRIRNTGNKPISVLNPYLIIFEEDEENIEIQPQKEEFSPTTEAVYDARYIHPGQLLQKKLYFALPEKHKHKTICCQLSAQYGKNQVASSQLVRTNLKE